MSRYAQLLDIVQEINPKVILEVGTWNGKRAQEIMSACNAFYYGFDLFEDATDETDVREMNVKQHHWIDSVKQRLNGRSELIKGDTRKTLGEFVASRPEVKVDFAFIDGGHSVETISSDWENVRRLLAPGAVVVFDDYYTPEISGFGCNSVVRDLEHTVLPVTDRIISGQLVQMVRV